MADSEYQKRQDGDNTVFEVTPATVPKYTDGIVGGAICTLVFYFISFWLVPIGAALVYFSWVGDMRPKAHKSKATFRVSASAIETNGRAFNKNEIHRLIVNNGITKAAAGKIVTGRGHVLATVAHSLELESGGKAYILAGGMNETTAYGLMKDVSRIIEFSV